MKIKHQVPIGRLIGKIDNDFNISESDWIPRVAAWTIDALSQLKCLPMVKKKRKLDVSERVAIFPCTLQAEEIEVYDENGCSIPSNEEENECGCNNFSSSENIGREIGVYNNKEINGVPDYNIVNINSTRGKHFVLDGNKIELNFDTKYIIVKSYEVATYYDDYYDCDCPYIYDNGLLLEALAWYCLYKYLSRGSTHPVYSLKSASQATNPYIQWINIKSKAKASVLNSISNDDGWRNFFYNSTFDPRRN